MKALFYLLLIVPIHCFGGSNDFDLRNYWMPYAAAAYDDNPNRCFKNVESLYDLSNHSISVRVPFLEEFDYITYFTALSAIHYLLRFSQ
jgi:hypothetical protein